MAKSRCALAILAICAFVVLFGQGLGFVAPKPSQQLVQHRLVSGASMPEAIGSSGAGLLLTLAAGSVAYASALRKPRRTSLEAVGLFYATQTGNTETVATAIAEAAGVDAVDVSEYSAEDLAEYDGLIVGAPTWNTGADEYRTGVAWDDLIDDIKGLSLSGKPVAVFGCGDSAGYGDNFCDGIEEIHASFEAAGAKMVGYVDASGYAHSESKSDKGGKFLGCPFDEDNESDQTAERASAWISQIKGEGMPL